MSGYGYCPHCGAEVASRERRLNGNDTCAAGHVYPSAFTLSKLAAEWVALVRQTLAALRDSLDEHAAGTQPLTRRGASDWARRCGRTLNAIPRVKS